MLKYFFILFTFSSLLFATISFAHDFSHDHPTTISKPKINFSQEERDYIEKKKTIVMCTDPNWMPYEKFDKNGVYTGIAADYHDIISHYTGLDYIIVHTKTWPETLALAKAGDCDLLSILNSTPERTKYLNFTDEFIDSPSIFVTRERDKFINGIDDLKGKTLAIVKGYMIDELIKANHPSIKRIYADNIPEALKMVSEGKAFATAGSLLEMSYNISTSGMLNLKITGDAKYDYKLKVGVKKSDLILLSIMQKTLASISKVQRGQILNNWVSINYQQNQNHKYLWKIIIIFSIILVIIGAKNIVTAKYNNKLINLNKKLELKVVEEATKRIENERLLMQQSKHAAMGDMIGAIAHQWRQPLNAVGLIVQDTEDAYETGTLSKDLLKDNVAKTMALILQMSNTIDDFSNFFKPNKDLENFRICMIISEVSNMFLPQMKSHGIKLLLSCTDMKLDNNVYNSNSNFDCCHSVVVEGYPNEFKHVVLNILKNAMDAFDESTKKDKTINVYIDIANDGFAVLKISDNGGGIREEIKHRIFEPYFTTKADNKGVGIGLYMSKQIIQNMGGDMWFENIDDGAAFFIKLKVIPKL
ncbi:MAG: hypothetical protein C0603_07945 [Denitrovibrio sp.]|nr:MAG: hypothetical protein C0603_07945 [Denitrovibrio sp.]